VNVPSSVTTCPDAVSVAPWTGDPVIGDTDRLAASSSTGPIDGLSTVDRVTPALSTKLASTRMAETFSSSSRTT